jgi:DNA-binding response OmpR family regulator
MLDVYPDLARPSPPGATCRRCGVGAMLRRDGYDLCAECYMTYVAAPVDQQETLSEPRIARPPSTPRPARYRPTEFPPTTLVMNDRMAIWQGVRVHLTPQRRTLLDLLAEASPEWVDRKDATRAVYGDESFDHILNAGDLLYRLRRSLPGLIVVAYSRRDVWGRIRITAPVQYVD